MRTTCFLLFLSALTTAGAADFVVDVKSPRQTIRHFGASDAWSMQTIGLWPNEQEQTKIADWLFSMQTDAQGQPLGIGLSLWRFNLGAGSAEQGREAQINRSTRTECFLICSRMVSSLKLFRTKCFLGFPIPQSITLCFIK